MDINTTNQLELPKGSDNVLDSNLELPLTIRVIPSPDERTYTQEQLDREAEIVKLMISRTTRIHY